MSSIVEIIAPVKADCPTFLVNNAAVSGTVDCSDAGGAGTFNILKNVLVKSKLQPNDNITIISAGIILPMGFTFANQTGTNSLPGMNVIFQIGTLPSFTSVFIPMENYDIGINSYQDLSGETFISSTLSVQINTIQINMIGVPAAYNTKTIYAIPYLRIEHNLPLI